MERESLVWIGVSLITLYLVWKTVEPLISPTIFGLAMVYIFHPLHARLTARFNEKKSAILLTALMTVISTLLTIGVVLWLRDVTRYIYIYIDEFFQWLSGVSFPFGVSETLKGLSQTIPEKLSVYLLNYTFSLPKFLLQAIIFLGIFYITLSNARFLSKEMYNLLPKENRELGVLLIEKAKITLSAILRTWLMLSVVKGIFLATGMIMFDISNVSGAIAAGVLCMVLELLPMVGGWILWLIGSFYLISSGDVVGGILFGVYGAIFISPVPDITVRPKLVAQGARVNPIVAFIGIFGGIMSFGFKGIIIGPVSLGLLVTLLEEWKEQKRREMIPDS